MEEGAGVVVCHQRVTGDHVQQPHPRLHLTVPPVRLTQPLQFSSLAARAGNGWVDVRALPR